MKVEIRIYKRYDTDLVALVDNGYPVGEMMRAAVTGYANGQPVYFQLDEVLFFDMNRKNNVRLRFDVPKTDAKTIHLLQNIKHGYRNSFCKMVLRDALSHQNLGCYFADENMLPLQEKHTLTDVQNKTVVSFKRVNRNSRINSFGKERKKLDANVGPAPANVISPTQNVIITEEPAPSVDAAPVAPVQNKPPKPPKPQPENKPIENVSANDLMAQFDSL